MHFIINFISRLVTVFTTYRLSCLLVKLQTIDHYKFYFKEFLDLYLDFPWQVFNLKNVSFSNSTCFF